MNELMITLILISLLSLPVLSKAQSVMLAKNWQDSSFHLNDTINWSIAPYYMSEKYDGVRAIYKDGVLKTRADTVIQVPKWFEKALTSCSEDCSIEGELWLGRSKFDELSGLIRSQNPLDKRWNKVEFRVFDAPHIKGDFSVRKQWFETWVTTLEHKQIKSAGHQLIQNQKQLDEFYQIKVAQGGEGVMVINGASDYQTGRSNDLIKRKPLMDAEATVVGYTKGKGKYEGLMGALIVQDASGREFKIGTGFTVAQRTQPPKIGESITFAFNGFTKNGLPRFARFLRIRDES